MPQNNEEEFSVQEVFNVISSYLKNEQLYERSLNILREDANYKSLLTTGENQYLNGPSGSSIAEETERSKSETHGLNKLVVQVDNGIDKIVREKFQGEFLDKLKDEVFQAILLLSSNQAKSSEDVTQPSTSITKPRRGRKKKVLSQAKVLTNNVVQNGRRGKKAASNAVNGQRKSIVETKIENDDSTQNGSNVLKEEIAYNGITRSLLEDKMDLNADDLRSLFSVESPSSVHTSDLSSFEDEISLSSDEELGMKRRLSLKEVKEKLDRSKSDYIDSEEENEQAKCYKIEDEQSKFPINVNSSSGILQKSPRKRKLNSKYFDDNIVFPIKKERASASSRSLCGDTPGRKARSICGDTSRRKARSICGDSPSIKARSVCGDTPLKRAQSVSSDTPQKKRGRPKKYLK